MFTRTYDIVSGAPWPTGIGERVRRSGFTDEWHQRDAGVANKREALAREIGPGAGTDRRAILYGQAAGSVRAVRAVADVVREISGDAERLLRERSRVLVVAVARPRSLEGEDSPTCAACSSCWAPLSASF